MFDICDMLSKTKPFQFLENRQLLQVSVRLKKRTLLAGEFLYKVGEPSEGFYIVYRGCLQIYKIDRWGNPVLKEQYNTGQAFGEQELKENTTRSTFAMATQPSYLFKLEAADFRDLISWWPELRKDPIQDFKATSQFDSAIAERRINYQTVTIT